MGRSVTSVLAIGVFSFGFLLAKPIERGSAAVEEASVLQADGEFVQTAAKGDSASVAKLLDADFTWTDAEGKTFSRVEVLGALTNLRSATKPVRMRFAKRAATWKPSWPTATRST